MIKLAQKPSSGCVGGEVVGCRAAEDRDKANGIDEARGPSFALIASQPNRAFRRSPGVYRQNHFMQRIGARK